MRNLFIISILVLISCNGNHDQQRTQTDADTTAISDSVIVAPGQREWQKGFGLTYDPGKDSVWNKPVSFYIEDPACSGLARDFYYGLLRPTDDSTTDELLKLVTTANSSLRPFYRWCLDKTIIIQDGALGELTGLPARQYAEKFPREFFVFMDSDTSGEKYKDWVSSISYSGYYDADDEENPDAIRSRMSETMKKNCSGCDEKILTRIEEFAKDCFSL